MKIVYKFGTFLFPNSAIRTSSDAVDALAEAKKVVIADIETEMT